MSITRRRFLETAAVTGIAAGTLAADPGKTALPTRVLGKTGVRVSILAFGTGSRFLMYKEEDAALEALTRALDSGITYIDTADEYGKGHLAEQRVGKVLKGRRDSVFLATKVSPRDGAEAARSFEESLKALQVDRVDLLHIHALTTEDDLAKIEAKGGVLEQVLKFREQKMARFIGITSHADPAVMKTALERHDFDCTQMALNAGMANMINGGGKRGMVPNPAVQTSFESLALPVALRKKMGILAIKAFAQDALIGQAAPEKLLTYTLSLPITAAVVGMPKLEHIDSNVRIAKAFVPMPPAEMRELAGRLSEKNKVALDEFFRHHLDA
uniref:Aldo/keto reductase n=1 Tax=Solibacter usitatus (strain Ellin6076) TaxID=234267 RepID=Q022Y6_SOLUE